MRGLQNMPISFPGLFGEWEFNVNPKALDIGNGIYWYGIIIAVGLMLAVLFCMKKSREFGLTEDHVIDVVLCGTPAAIVCARIYYVVFNLDFYRTAEGSLDWGRMIAIWDGGIAIYGSIIGALLAAIIYSKVKKVKLWALTDLCVMGLLIGQAIGRWGNFVNREAFGAETTLPWRMRIWISVAESMEVHPTFLYESLWNVVGLLLIWLVVTKGRRFDGENTCFYFAWYGLGRLWIEGLRTDSLYLFDWTLFGEPIRVSQALSLVLVIAALFLLVYHTRIKHHSREELLVNQVAALATVQEETAAEEVAAVEEAEAAETVAVETDENHSEESKPVSESLTETEQTEEAPCESAE